MLSVPATQVVPTQHPPPHVSGPQFGVPSQRPPAPGSAVQVWPELAQLWHCWPFAPHVVASVPGRHLSPTQQPLQFVASQRVVLHARVAVSHARPCSSQSEHARPPLPHALASVPERQRWRPSSKLQQPFGHDAGPHPGSSRPHTRLAVQTEKPSDGQSAQRPPAEPHARESVPVRQIPAASQQPVGQVEALQGRGVTVPPSESVSGSRLDRPHAKNTNSAAVVKSTAKTRPRAGGASEEKRMRKVLSKRERSGTTPSPVACERRDVDLAYLAIPFFQRALVAGCVLAALLALLGVLVTARGLAYLGDGLSHAAFGGIALGMFVGLASPLVLAIPFTALAAIAIGALRRRGGLRSDVAMAILFAVCFAVGVILLRSAKRTQSTFDPEQLLFGNILLVGREDLWVVLGIAAVTVAFVVFAWTRLAYATFDEELARLSGIEVGWLESALLALLAAVIVAAIRLAGVVLVSAFLVVPAATGRLLGRTLVGVVGFAVLASVLGVLAGFVAAHDLDWPAGATIVLALAAFFAAAAGVRKART